MVDPAGPSPPLPRAMATKEKVDRTYDADGFRRRSACLCFRDAAHQEVLLVSSLRHRGQWVVPGGGIEPAESSRAACRRELWEEAGVSAHGFAYLGLFEQDDGVHRHRTHVFSALLEDEVDAYKEPELGRRRHWFTVEEAKRQLQRSKPFQCSYFNGAPHTADAAPCAPSTSPRAARPEATSVQNS